MPGRPADETLELPLATAPGGDAPTTSGPERPGRRRWLEIGLALSLLVAVIVAAWQEGAASQARSELATLTERVADIDAELDALREENRSLQRENDALRSENERLRISAGTADEQDLVSQLLPYLRERLGDSLGELGGLGLDELGDLLGRGWDELGRGWDDLAGP